ncbi:unnamed protein product [Adineta steineri]|uniref:NHL repeat containing protein n=1 Tax=Adineta steineri TaxID=433720 RepID=A0A814ZW88_9BILA|nr:unnamed protein product [Adineta steineri]
MNSNLSPTSINQPRWKYFQQRKLMWITILIIVIVLIIIIPIIIIKSKKPVVADVSTTGSRINIPSNARWKQNGITIAGGNYDGDALNQLESPRGLYVDDEQSVYIADTSNQRIMKWKNDAASGEVVAGGNEQGNRTDQLNQPTDVIVDKATDSFIICDRENRRVMTWSRRNSTTSGEIIIANIKCWRLTMDNQRFLYVTDTDKHEVRRFRMGETQGKLVAGGNGANKLANIAVANDAREALSPIASPRPQAAVTGYTPSQAPLYVVWQYETLQLEQSSSVVP